MVHEIKIWMARGKDWQKSPVPMSLEIPESNCEVTPQFLNSWESFVLCSFSEMILAMIRGYLFIFNCIKQK